MRQKVRPLHRPVRARRQRPQLQHVREVEVHPRKAVERRHDIDGQDGLERDVQLRALGEGVVPARGQQRLCFSQDPAAATCAASRVLLEIRRCAAGARRAAALPGWVPDERELGDGPERDQRAHDRGACAPPQGLFDLGGEAVVPAADEDG